MIKNYYRLPELLPPEDLPPEDLEPPELLTPELLELLELLTPELLEDLFDEDLTPLLLLVLEDELYDLALEDVFLYVEFDLDLASTFLEFLIPDLE